MPTVDLPGWTIPLFVLDLLIAAAAIALAMAVHWIAVRLAHGVSRRTSDATDDVFVDAAVKPARWLFVALALALVRGALHLGPRVDALWSQAAGLIVPALVGWLVIALIGATNRAVALAADISVADNLHARRRRTRADILTRIAVLVVGFVTLCLMLLSIPSVRSVGVTLMASAGLAALAVGAAAQPALKNLIAGIQMAFTEPIRLDDVVIIEGEWGRIEEIRLTYVIVRIWDERRLVVPVSRFLEAPFQNWTRQSAELLGTAFLYLDPTADIARLRDKLDAYVRAHPKWDGRVVGLQVTDVARDAIEARCLVSAANAGNAFDLRCDVREAMMAFIRDDMPQALPRTRAALGGGEWRSAREAKSNGSGEARSGR